MTSTWIPLLVPENHYLELAALVAERLDELGFDRAASDTIEIRLAVSDGAHSADHPRELSAADKKLAAHIPWTVENLRRLIASETVTAQRWVRALDVCMNHVGEFVSTQQIAEESGMTIADWRSACRKMKAHQRTNYPDETSWWPLAGEGGRILGHSYDQLYVAITPAQAERWAEAKGMVR